MGQAGSNNLLAFGHPLLSLGPEHAATIARDGYTKRQVKEFIFEHARFPLGRLGEEYRRLHVDQRHAVDSARHPPADREIARRHPGDRRRRGGQALLLAADLRRSDCAGAAPHRAQGRDALAEHHRPQALATGAAPSAHPDRRATAGRRIARCGARPDRHAYGRRDGRHGSRPGTRARSPRWSSRYAWAARGARSRTPGDDRSDAHPERTRDAPRVILPPGSPRAPPGEGRGGLPPRARLHVAGRPGVLLVCLAGALMLTVARRRTWRSVSPAEGRRLGVPVWLEPGVWSAPMLGLVLVAMLGEIHRRDCWVGLTLSEGRMPGGGESRSGCGSPGAGRAGRRRDSGDRGRARASRGCGLSLP